MLIPMTLKVFFRAKVGSGKLTVTGTVRRCSEGTIGCLAQHSWWFFGGSLACFGSTNLIDSDCILYTNSIQILMIPSGPAVDQPR